MKDSECDKPFETRVFRMPVVSWPGSIEICGYCTAAQMQPELVAALVVETEKAIRGRLTHTTRKTFPELRTGSVREEVLWAWKNPNRTLNLSNPLSNANHVSITASRHPNPKGAAFPVDHGVFRVLMRSGAPKCLTVLRRLTKYGQLSHAFFARADSPEWWNSYRKIKDSEKGIVFPSLRLVAEPGWAIGERFGWISYFGPRAAAELGLDEAAGRAELYKVEETPNGGRLVWLTKEPFNFCDEGHRRVYRDLVSALAPQTISHWP